jgi:hypothetical protein
MLRQGDSQVFKKYSQMKLQMKREALDKINRANEMSGVFTQRGSGDWSFDTVEGKKWVFEVCERVQML